MLLAYGFKTEFEAYLNEVEDCKIHSLEELIQFNKDETETELPSRELSPCPPDEEMTALLLIAIRRESSSRPARKRILS